MQGNETLFSSFAQNLKFSLNWDFLLPTVRNLNMGQNSVQFTLQEATGELEHSYGLCESECLDMTQRFYA